VCQQDNLFTVASRACSTDADVSGVSTIHARHSGSASRPPLFAGCCSDRRWRRLEVARALIERSEETCRDAVGATETPKERDMQIMETSRVSIRLMVASVIMTSIAAIDVELSRQEVRIDPREVIAIRVSVETLAEQIRQFAGMKVRVTDAIVDRVVSPRAFILTGQRTVLGIGGRSRIGVVVPSGAVNVVKDMLVVVTGAARTFAGAQVSGALPRAGALTEYERDALRHRPLIVASSVATPGEIELLRLPLDDPLSSRPIIAR
jgi:hypothetical protein